MSDPPTQPFSPFPKRKPVYENNWFLIAVGLVVVVLVVIGSGVKAMNNHQNAQVAKVQLQVRADQDAAAAKAKVAAAAVAKAKQDGVLAKAQQDAADAKRLAQANGNGSKVIVVQPPGPRYRYMPPPNPGPIPPPNPGPLSFMAKVASMSSQAAAQQYVPRIEALGYAAQVLYSSNYSHLTPGYWIVGAGPYSTLGDANQAAFNLKSIASDSYAVCLGSEASCAGQD